MPVGHLTLPLAIPGCASLKEKRSRLKPLLARLTREFNLSAAEIDQQDVWQSALVQCALVSNDAVHLQRSLQKVVNWIETNWLDLEVEDDRIELL
jgi:uncharacterized protein YlxP (DUF503 family)